MHCDGQTKCGITFCLQVTNCLGRNNNKGYGLLCGFVSGLVRLVIISQLTVIKGHPREYTVLIKNKKKNLKFTQMSTSKNMQRSEHEAQEHFKCDEEI